MIEPLRFSFVVGCGVDHAFATWTTRVSAWWPLDHTVSCEGGLQVVIEPGVGGRIFERTASGREIEWGEITAWEPPRRLRYLWHLRSDRADATEVEIVFTALARASTRVDIEHRGWERFGAAGRARRDANQSGWAGLLPVYVAACSVEPGAARQSGIYSSKSEVKS
jgi:uncharacterized protein YndB with AHSA1/START domain